MAAPAEVSEPAPRQRRDRELVGLVSFSHALQHVYVGVLPLTYPFVIAEFHVSYTVLGAVLGAVGVAGGLLQAAAGLYQRISARAVLAAQNLLMALTAAGLGLAPSFPVFGGVRFLGAVVSSPQHPVGNAVLVRRFPERRARVLSWHVLGGNVGTLAVPLLASALIVRWGWRWTLLGFALPIALGGLLVAARMREGRGQGEEGGAAAATAAGAARPVWSRGPLVVIAAGTIAAGGRGLGVINTYVPAYLHNGLGLAQLTVGVVFTVVLAGSVAGPLLAGPLADRFGRRSIALAAYTAGALALIAFGEAGAWLPGLLVLGALVGLLAYSESALLQALFADAVGGGSQQAAFGIYFAISYGAGSLWVAVLGWTIDHWGFAATFAVMAASFLAAGATLLLGGGRRGGERGDPGGRPAISEETR